jgi:hypothetical protein
VCRQIIETQISLDFDDHPSGTMMKQDTSQQIASDLESRSLVKRQTHSVSRSEQSLAGPLIRGDFGHVLPAGACF